MNQSAPGGRSPLVGRYTAQKRSLRLALSSIDFVLRRGRPAAPPKEIGLPRRILLSNGGHLGDVVIASSVIPLIKAAWPETEIGILVGSWSRFVLQGHESIRWIHTVDHWKLNRAEIGLTAKLRRYIATRRQAIREIREVGYDVAIDLYAYFPNTIPLLRQAGIPVRVGYESGGFGPLLTHSAAWEDSDRHTAEYHQALLALAGVPLREGSVLRYSLPTVAQPPAGVPVRKALPDGYLVLHMGAGSKLKEWPAERWSELVGRLLGDGYQLAFTGSGAEQAEAAERVIAGRARCQNLCDKLSWEEFVQVVSDAALVISVDSVTGHIAAAVDTPTVVLMAGISKIAHWRPLSDRALTVTREVPCAACHRSEGCSAMTCVRDIAVEEVLAAVRRQLKAAPSRVAEGAR